MMRPFLPNRELGLADERIDDRLLERRAEVVEAPPLLGTTVLLDPHPDGGLQPTERKIERAAGQRTWKSNRARIALPCERIDDSPAWVAKTEQLGYLVKGLARRVVSRLPEHAVCAKGQNRNQ